MTMVATTPDVVRPSPDVAAGDLLLRICNSWRQGQMVRLKSAKCTVGSGPRCTLRLRARGVSPLHCLILRGPATTVVRRWAADTRLNDQSFADAVLSPGDRLSIGSIELEVVSIGATSVEPKPLADRPRQSAGQIDLPAMLQRQALEEEQHRLDELAANLQQYEASLASDAERYHAQRTDVEAQRQAIDQERQQWQAERDEARRQLDEQRNDLAARLADFQARENVLAEERRQWETERSQDASQVATEGERLNARQAELNAERHSFEQQQQQWQAERDEARRQLDEQRNELAARLADFQARENVLAEERRQWETERSRDASQVATEGERLNARQAELNAERHSFEQQQQQWQAERDEARRQLDEQRNELAARLADFQARENVLAEERRQWETERSQDASQVATEGERLNARQAELNAERHSFEQQQQQWQAERDEARRQLDEQRNELAARLADLEAERSALEADRRQWEEQRAELARAAEQPPVPSEAVAEVECPDQAAPQEPEFKTPTDGAPVDLAEVFRRVGANVETEEDASPAPSLSADHVERPRGDREPPPAAAEHGEEESLDNYMSRLMQRMRSKSDESELATYAPSRSEPQAARRSQAGVATAPSPAVQPLLPTPAIAAREPVEMSPRSAAPEKRDDLSAFRELANFSARTAISRHSRRTLIETMRSKLVMGMMALASGGGLFWMWQRYGAVEMTLYYSLAAVLVAIYFGVQYALLTGRLRINEQGHLNIDWNAFANGRPTTPPREDDAASGSPATPVASANPVDDGSAEPAAEDASHGQ